MTPSSQIRSFSTSSQQSITNQDSSPEWAEAFPINSIIPEDLLREIVQKKRMRKLEENEAQPSQILTGVFPEIVFDPINDKDFS